MLELELGKGAPIRSRRRTARDDHHGIAPDQSSTVTTYAERHGLNAAMLLAAALCDARGRCVREIQPRRCQLGADGATRVAEAIVHASRDAALGADTGPLEAQAAAKADGLRK